MTKLKSIPSPTEVCLLRDPRGHGGRLQAREGDAFAQRETKFLDRSMIVEVR